MIDVYSFWQAPLVLFRADILSGLILWRWSGPSGGIARRRDSAGRFANYK